MSTRLRARGPQGGPEQVTLPCFCPLVYTTERTGWDDLRRAFHTQSSVCIFRALGFHPVLLKLPLIKIQLKATDRKPRVKG